jgi:hypothetical protein
MSGMVLHTDASTRCVELSGWYEGSSPETTSFHQVVVVFEGTHIGLHRLIDGVHTEQSASFELAKDGLEVLIRAYDEFLSQHGREWDVLFC